MPENEIILDHTALLPPSDFPGCTVHRYYET